jgi:hypothetical protein
MTHWLHTDHYWLFRGGRNENPHLVRDGTSGCCVIATQYYCASPHIVPCSRKSRPHQVAFDGTSFFIKARFVPATAFACSNGRGRTFLIRATPPERAAKVTFYSLDREVVRSLPSRFLVLYLPSDKISGPARSHDLEVPRTCPSAIRGRTLLDAVARLSYVKGAEPNIDGGTVNKAELGACEQ